MQHEIEVKNISPEKATNPKYNVYVDNTCVQNNISWIEVMRSIENIYLTDQAKHEERINTFLDNIEHTIKRAQAYIRDVEESLERTMKMCEELKKEISQSEGKK